MGCVCPKIGGKLEPNHNVKVLPGHMAPRKNWRSDETYYQAPGDRRDDPKIKNINNNEGNKRAMGDCLRDLLEWLEEFAENLEDTEAPAHAHISHDSDSERPTKVAPRKHSIYPHFPKTEIAKSASEQK